ncbi:NADPH-dependent FMN reductase [Maribellus comscasis]|uniref:NADPH-dependent FMN reductase n=1 Tax=Maribellus comscasis TaxID=2681766 RepID=A0A6I6K756_9BACT|nr:flavodoxin family protein [Maribellus comscasis]QGY47483.1 NADPH-dependent FMN reductase [Maribellus comscasis]
MKVIAFIGSVRKKHTYESTEGFLKKLQACGNIDYEMVRLSEYKLGVCNGCKLCLDKGEELCPIKDDRNLLLEKIKNSDGVVFASPNYSFHVSALMKQFLDRLAFIFHRPQFFGKTCTSIIAQGVYGGNKIVKYFNFVGKALGFNVVKGICVTNLEPVSEKAVAKNEQKIEKLAGRFYKQLIKNELPQPSLFDLFIFRMSRTSMKMKLDENFKDFKYYTQKGWFNSDFFYPVKLSPAKKILGRLFDKLAMKTV